MTGLKHLKKLRTTYSRSRQAAAWRQEVSRAINFTYCCAGLRSKMHCKHPDYRTRRPLRHASIWDIVQGCEGIHAKQPKSHPKMGFI
jgi:hypothetical protein